MTNKELILDAMRRIGKTIAEELQARSVEMDGTAINSEADYIPQFKAVAARENMLNRKAGQTDGFVCRSTAGRVVRLIQNYDSEIYTQEPEELPAQWRFVWSQNPAHALPFVALSTSPYMIGDCCLNEAGKPKRSNMDNNVWSPDINPEFWDDVYQPDETTDEGETEPTQEPEQTEPVETPEEGAEVLADEDDSDEGEVAEL